MRDGAQCRLQRDAARVAEEERRRLAAHGLDVRDVRVAFMLRDDVLPKRCLPKDAEAFFAAHPRAREGLVKATGAVCEACGCPEPWFFCAEAAAPPEAMKRAGYAPLP